MTRTHQATRDKRMLMLGMLFAAAAGLVMASTSAADARGGNHGRKPGKRGKAHHMKRMNRMFNRLDVNSDSRLSKAELAAAPRRLRRRLARADTNGDSFITRAELRAATAKWRRGGKGRFGKQLARRANRMFKRLDVDKNGMLTPNEVANAPRRAKRLLRRADLNGNGVITKAELRRSIRSFMRSRRGKRGWRRHRRGGPNPYR